MRILMVCTGNICRSPTAEGVLRARAAARGLDARVEVDGCGTHGYHVGDPPDPRAVAAAARRGVDLSELRARCLDAADFERFDLLLAMDRGHLAHLNRMCPPAHAHKLRLYLDLAPDLGPRDVPDPWYGDLQDFEHVLDLVEEVSERLLDAIADAAVRG